VALASPGPIADGGGNERALGVALARPGPIADGCACDNESALGVAIGSAGRIVDGCVCGNERAPATGSDRVKAGDAVITDEGIGRFVRTGSFVRGKAGVTKRWEMKG
jgi:hypothetical protein